MKQSFQCLKKALIHSVNNMEYFAEKYIHSLLKFGIKPGLQRVSELCNGLENPQNELKFIHVAGTNGKGSVSTQMANILAFAGYKTGLFISPYILDFRERIQINSEWISKDDLESCTFKVKAVAEKMAEQPTEFEVITAIAFLYFKEQNCDYVVLETGLGGRFDSTNIIKKPECSIITSISLDHMAVLGDTISQIAYEKCGIIKDNGITVSYPKQDEDALKVIKQSAKDKNNKLFLPEKAEVINESINGTAIAYKGLKYDIPMIGEHQVLNTITTIEAALQLGIPTNHIVNGIRNTKLPARVEVISENPLIVLDGGHNEAGAKALSYVLKKHVDKEIVAVMGMMADKECDKLISEIAPLCKTVIATEVPENPRTLKADELAHLVSEYTEAIAIKNPEEAFYKAKELAGNEKSLLVCGSLYLASEIKKFI